MSYAAIKGDDYDLEARVGSSSSNGSAYLQQHDAPPSSFDILDRSGSATGWFRHLAQRILRRPDLKRNAVYVTIGLIVITLLAGYHDEAVRSLRAASFGSSAPRLGTSYADVQQKLPWIPTDTELQGGGEQQLQNAGPFEEYSRMAVWPDDYPRAAAIIARNTAIRDVSDPWPEKPYIASTWLSPTRFPEGLDNLPHDPTFLPELHLTRGQPLPAGLHNPPLPDYPSNVPKVKSLTKLAREDLYQATWWSPLKGGMPTPRPGRKVQAEDWPSKMEKASTMEQRRGWVKRAFLHAWEGYKANAFGHDEISPVSRGFRDGYNFWGASTIDNLDTLLIMNLTHEYNLARTHVRALDFTMLAKPEGCTGEVGPKVHLFETVIRYLGGLLSAYDLSGDQLMLDRAKELGDLLLPAFCTSSGIPPPFYELGTDLKGGPPGAFIGAEPTSVQMEMTRLSQLTGDIAYFNAAQRVIDRFAIIRGPDAKVKGSFGSLISTTMEDDGTSWGSYTIGAMTDSYYEYLIKMCQLLGDDNGIYSRMYQQAVEDLYRYLFVNVTVLPDRPGLVVIGSRVRGSTLKPQQEHLATFAGGMFGLGSKILGRKEDLATGMALTDSAVWSYASTATGLMAENMAFYEPHQKPRWRYEDSANGRVARLAGQPVGSARQLAPDYRGRPEAIESVFYMYRLTGDSAWQDRGWQMFCAWIAHALTPVGLANVLNVNQSPSPLVDMQESFVLAETLKYYYLLFSPTDTISLDDYVFNTEAHPFRVPLKEHGVLWRGPEPEVEKLYADPRDRHLYDDWTPEKDRTIPVGRGTAQQQKYRADTCNGTVPAA